MLQRNIQAMVRSNSSDHGPAANMTEVGGQRNGDGLARGQSFLYLKRAFSTCMQGAAAQAGSKSL
jgi:hypothetical protein